MEALNTTTTTHSASTATTSLFSSLPWDELVLFDTPKFAHLRTLQSEYYLEIYDIISNFDKPFRWWDVNNLFYAATNFSIMYMNLFHIYRHLPNTFQKVVLAMVTMMVPGGLAWHLYEESFDDACLVHLGGGTFVVLALYHMIFVGGRRVFWSHSLPILLTFMGLGAVENHDPKDPLFHQRHWASHALELTSTILVERLVRANYDYRQQQQQLTSGSKKMD